MKKLLCLVALAFVQMNANAQIDSAFYLHAGTDTIYTIHDSSYAIANKAIFENIDASRVPTGILLDYGIAFIDLNRFNGESRNDTNAATYNIVEQINSTLYSSQIVERTNPLPPPQVLHD